MTRGRLEAFSDGVLAIIITIMVLEMRTPEGTSLRALLPDLPVLLSYVLSFIYVGIYWINHHHLFQAVPKVNGVILWLNLHLLFWLSLIPFVTGWVGENHINAIPVAFYGGVLFMCAVAFRILERQLLKYNPESQVLKAVLKDGRKEIFSALVYLVAIPVAFLNVYVSAACYFLVACAWMIPNKEIEALDGRE